MTQQKRLGLIVTGVAAAVAIGVGVTLGLSGGDEKGDGDSGKPAAKGPAYCTGGAGSWDERTGVCGINHVAGCQHSKQMTDLNTKLVKENPIGSSGYGGDTPVVPLLKQLKQLTDKELDQPHIPAPIKSALRQEAADLEKEMDLYQSKGDWVKVDQDRSLKHSASMACLNFVADQAGKPRS
ncbi:hypothetical protein OHA45_36990 [Streptomyces lydicus]|uniref:hypothetical protein n=1 Tax=Streptomyces lydicus TaxID=47763 RepID=UPI002E3296EC|nr:hypothetical protein [Streptomyces lydicus]